MGFLIKIPKKKIENIDLFLNTAVDYVIEGKLIAFPTDSIYGLGGDPFNLEVIEKIYRIKFRERDKGFLLLVADLEEALKIAEFNDMAIKLAERFWPGQLTLILKRKTPNIIPLEVSAHKETIGLRVPQNEIITSILNLLKEKGHFGGIIGTSANYSNEPPSVSGIEVSKKFLSHIDLIIDAGTSKSQIPTTIVDCTEIKPMILRTGVINEEEVLQALKF